MAYIGKPNARQVVRGLMWGKEPACLSLFLSLYPSFLLLSSSSFFLFFLFLFLSRFSFSFSVALHGNHDQPQCVQKN
jgi:hypothetical protein